VRRGPGAPGHDPEVGRELAPLVRPVQRHRVDLARVLELLDLPAQHAAGPGRGGGAQLLLGHGPAQDAQLLERHVEQELLERRRLVGRGAVAGEELEHLGVAVGDGQGERLRRRQQGAEVAVAAVAGVPGRLEDGGEVVDLDGGVVPHRDELVGGAPLGRHLDVALAQEGQEQLLGHQRVDRLRQLLAQVVRQGVEPLRVVGLERDRRLEEGAQEVDLGQQVGARQRGLERQLEVARQAVEATQVGDERVGVARLAAEGGRPAQRPGVLDQGGGLTELLDQIAEDLGVGGRAGGHHPQGLVDDLDLVMVQEMDRDHFGRLQHRLHPTTVAGWCRGAALRRPGVPGRPRRPPGHARASLIAPPRRPRPGPPAAAARRTAPRSRR
jgi:hypothetical protein